MRKAISTFGYSARKEYVVINCSRAKGVAALKSGKRENAWDLKSEEFRSVSYFKE